MGTRIILTDGNPLLRKKSREVAQFDQKLHTLLDDMHETLDKAGGVGIAAVQVGILKRACIISDGEEDETRYELINPVIKQEKGSEKESEGCLSVPGYSGEVVRPKKLVVECFDRFGEIFTLDLKDMLARVAYHEIDHMDGILYIDKAVNVVKN